MAFYFLLFSVVMSTLMEVIKSWYSMSYFITLRTIKVHPDKGIEVKPLMK